MNAQPEAGGRTAWARNLAAPVRDFLSTESGGAVVLLCAALAALLWANSPWPDSYEDVWTTDLSIRLGDAGISQDLRQWVNEGLMTFFFLVLGLEAKRELDLGQLRERRRHLDPPDRRARRHVGAGPDLPRVQRRRLRRRRLGRRDVDGHGVRARRARAGGSGRHAAARAPAHARDLRRPRGAAGDRHRLHGRRLARPARDRCRALRACSSRCGTRRSNGGGRSR